MAHCHISQRGKSAVAQGARRVFILNLLLALTTAACHHSTRRAAPPPVHSQVNYQAIPDQTAAHYQLNSSQGVIGADMVRDNVAPVYPPDMIKADRKDVDIGALLIVGRDGKVHEVRIAGRDAQGAKAPFALAVAAATLQWRFTPLRITTWEDTPDGGSRRIAAKPEPFSQRYRFHFSIVDGKPAVTTSLPGAAQ